MFNGETVNGNSAYDCLVIPHAETSGGIGAHGVSLNLDYVEIHSDPYMLPQSRESANIVVTGRRYPREQQHQQDSRPSVTLLVILVWPHQSAVSNFLQLINDNNMLQNTRLKNRQLFCSYATAFRG